MSIGFIVPLGYDVVQRDGAWYWHTPPHPEGEGTVALRPALSEADARARRWRHYHATSRYPESRSS